MSNDIDTKVIYEQLCQDFRSLNGFLWQTPIIVMTLTGGLWFSVATFELTDEARRALLIFAGAADLLMIAALVRLRYVMATVQLEIRRHDGRPAAGRNGIFVGIFSLLLLLTSAGSLIAGVDPARYFSKREPAAQTKPNAQAGAAPSTSATIPSRPASP